MLHRPYRIYAYRGHGSGPWALGYSTDTGLLGNAASGTHTIEPLSPKGRLDIIHHAHATLLEALATGGSEQGSLLASFARFFGLCNRPDPHDIRSLRGLALGVSAKLGLAGDVAECHPGPGVVGIPENAEALRGILGGKVLTLNEVIRCIAENGIGNPNTITGTLDYMNLIGSVSALPGIMRAGGGRACSRCGCRQGIEPEYCPKCLRNDCFVCPECRAMGEVRSCDSIFVFPGSPRASGAGVGATLELGFGLTEPQVHASSALRSFIADGNPGSEVPECLVWAVCGAGKTEVAFAAVHEALGRGRRVLFAIPRRDVVKELEDRVRSAFPGVSIEVLYGGSEKAFGRGDLVLATTHQVLRRNGEFGLVVLDEADAFPFLGSRMLRFGVRRAMAAGAKLVWMTATPDADMLKEVREGRIRVVTIPARHHRRPLPEPGLVRVDMPASRKGPGFGVPPVVVECIGDSLVKGRQVFVFVPTIDLVEPYVTAFGAVFSGTRCCGTTSRDPDRNGKREAFRDGGIRILVTTTIMERGITVRGCDVAVLHADCDRILDERALVQMAGRAGRAADHPDGKVVFFGTTLNGAMERALGQIRDMNKEAMEKGYLDVPV